MKMEEGGKEVELKEETLMTGGAEQEAHGSGRARRQIHSHMSRKVTIILVLNASWVVKLNIDIR